MKLSIAQRSSMVLLSLLAITAMKPVSTDEAMTAGRDVTPVLNAVPFTPPPVMLGDSAEYTPPDFAGYRDVSARKAAFYDYMVPKIRAVNTEVLRERDWLVQLAWRVAEGQPIADADEAELARMERRYSVDDNKGTVISRIAELMRRVDVVPASLVLATAAKESGWGTSRFAREGNNYFGIWCFYRGCGMTPRDRDEGRTHEVATFDTVADGIRYYIRTINTHPAYDTLRRMRADARARHAHLPGYDMAAGLTSYSERGLAYVKEIQSMIQYNQLARFTRRNPV
ncbi:MAG: glucosaminidase domain-containing protein [Pseudomonadales bacterium]|nr:glucosaminidase domain-containing protein [Pseudomonadales bacterium]